MGFGGGGAAGGGGTPSNSRSAPAVAYQPTAQPAADTLYQSLLGGFAGSLGPGGASAFQQMFPGATALDFSGTPGGQAYGMAQPWFGAGTISDPNNPLYQQALTAAQGTYQAYQPLTANYAQDYGQYVNPQNNPLFQNTFGAASQISPILQALGMSGLGAGAGQLGAGQSLISALGPELGQALGITNQAAGYAPGLLGSAALAGSGFGPAFNTALGGAGQASLGGQLLGGATTSGLEAFFPTLFNNAISNTFNAASGAPDLVSSSRSILNTAFDPQQALFNQLSNQVQQQQNAINAQTGVGGSPYGAGLTGTQLQNFDINWQNQQLARQQAGLGAAAGGFSNAAQLAQSPLQAMTTGFNTLGTAAPLLSAANQLQQAPLGAIGAGSNILSNLGGAIQTGANIGNLPLGALQAAGGVGQTAGNIQNQGLTLGGTGAQQALAGGNLPYQTMLQQAQNANTLQQNLGQQLQLMSAFGGQPYNTLQTGTQNALQGLSGLTNLGNQQFTIPQQLANDLQSYLMLGQAASGLSGQLGYLGQQQLANSLSGIGGALGTGSNLLFGNSLGQGGGLLGLAGINPFSGAGAAGTGLSTLGGGLGAGAFDAGIGGALPAGLAAADASGGAGISTLFGGLGPVAAAPAFSA